MYHKPSSTENATRLPIDQKAWLLHQFEELEVIRLHLPPGESMENHINEWRIIFFVLRGSGSLNVEGSIYKMEEQQSIAVKAGLERYWSNTGEQVLELLVLKTRDGV
ncbi:MAG: cupin domain-containing protein [Bacteroidota bacterium]|nr:cupin domain-containing protein [Bacteroidota bacterium]